MGISGKCCSGGELGVITVRVGGQLDYEAKFVAIMLDYFMYDRTGRSAVRSLIVDELYDGYDCALRPDVRVAFYWHIVSFGGSLGRGAEND